jgi:hypothetical protein
MLSKRRAVNKPLRQVAMGEQLPATDSTGQPPETDNEVPFLTNPNARRSRNREPKRIRLATLSRRCRRECAKSASGSYQPDDLQNQHFRNLRFFCERHACRAPRLLRGTFVVDVQIGTGLRKTDENPSAEEKKQPGGRRFQAWSTMTFEETLR